MTLAEMKDLSVDELSSELELLYKELFSLRLQKSTGQLTKPHLIRKARRNVARVNTLITSKESN